MRALCLCCLWVLLVGCLLGIVIAAEERAGGSPFLDWSQEDAVKILNQSAWARTVTFTQVIPGIGSGVSGEKEIYNAFYVRFLSAQPIREAYTRIQLIKHGYDLLGEVDRAKFLNLIEDRVDVDFSNWIVVAVSFRSNDPNQESTVRKYFASQTAGTLLNRAFLSTDRFPQVKLVGYYPPVEEEVGARFVFPRTIAGTEVISNEDNQVVFELTEAPAATSGRGSSGSGRGRSRSRTSRRSRDGDENNRGGILRASFAVEEMVDGDKLVY